MGKVVGANYFPSKEISAIVRAHLGGVNEKAISPKAVKRFLHIMRLESIAMLELYMPTFDEKTKKRALCTIKNLRDQG
jgi:hypothetical protein